MFVGGSRASPLPLGAGCRVYVDFAVAVSLRPFQATVPTWSQSLAIPLVQSLSGVTLTAQAIFAGTRSPLGYEVSNGVRLTMGQ